MKTIELSVKNFWFRYWNWLTFNEDNLPKTTCDFKRDLILCTLWNILGFPVLMIIRGIKLLSSKLDWLEGKEVSLLGMFIQGLWCIMAMTMPEGNSYFLNLILALLFIIFFIGLVAAIVQFIVYLSERPLYKYKEEKKPSFIKELYNSAKEKYCAIIEYKS